MNYRISLAVTLILFALVPALGLASCTGESPAPGPLAVEMPEVEVLVTVDTATEVNPSATGQLIATAEPSLEPSPTPRPTETLSPTPSPQPVTLAISSQWETGTATALQTAVGDGPRASYAWNMLIVEDPKAALAEGSAQVALVQGEDGTVVRTEPLAFSVPFTTNWEFISATDAEAILADGHSLVKPIPWSAMDPANKALRVDGRHPTDPDYPYTEKWSLIAAPGYEDATAALVPILTDALAPEPTIRLAAVGDLNLDRSVAYIITTTGDLAYPLSRVKPVFDAADYTIGNLETALGDVGEPAAKRYPFRSPPEAAQSLSLGGVDLVSLANNHAQDYGPEALLQGIDLLHAAGVATVGGGANDTAAHAPHIADINGLKVAFLGYVNVPIEAVTNFDTQSWAATAHAPGLAWADPERIRADVGAVRPDVDLVVVILHSGYEYIEEPSEFQVAAARAAVDAGADLVVGHHAHILQGIHRYKDGVIVYGLGNFLFDIDGPPETAIVNVWLDRDGVRQLELIPAIIQEHGQPRLAEAWESGPILSRVYYLTTLLNYENP